LKERNQNIDLEGLFRSKLENAEVIPDPALRASLMKKAARQNFFRFNPGKLNIFYLSSVVVAIVSVALLLPSGKTRVLQSSGMTYTAPGAIAYSNNDKITVKQEQSNAEKRSATNISQKGSEKTETASSKLSAQKPVAGTEPNTIARIIPSGEIFSSHVNNILQKRDKAQVSFVEPLSAAGCAPLKVKFANTLPEACDSCRWTFGDGGTSYEKDPEWIFDVEGEYKISLQVFCKNGKVFSSGSIVVVYPHPKANFEISPENATVPDDEIRFLNYSSNAVKFEWDFGDGYRSDLFEPSHKYSDYGSYNVKLVATSDNGCSDSLTVTNAFSVSRFYIDFPNAFIPNIQGPSGGYYSSKSDEAAQIFHPSFSGVTEYQLKVFSKLGVLIFESSDVSLGWDGYNKGQLCDPGVYIWKVRGKFNNGEPFTRMGDVTLLKN
jgi:PKD repeat protein